MEAGFVLVAAGDGKRLGSAVPKAFVDLGGQTLVVRTFEALQRASRFATAVVVVPAGMVGEAQAQLRAVARADLSLKVAAGGEERQHSVRAGLLALDASCSIIVVHDAARPFVSPGLVSSCIEAAALYGAATAGAPATDTIKQVDDSGAVTKTLDRSRLYLAQTPQAFRAELLREVHAKAALDGTAATDDASLVEHYGHLVRVVESTPGNLKITTPEDLAWARWRWSREPH